MSAAIESIVFSEGTRKVLKLAKANWVRKLSIGSNWSTLRIGVLVRAHDTGANYSNSFVLGLQSGTTDNYGSGNNMTNFLGLDIGRATDTDLGFAYTADPTYGDRYRTVYSMGFVKKVGATRSWSLLNTINFAANDSSPEQRKTPIIFQVEKGSPNFTCRFWAYNAGSFITPNYTYTNLDDTINTDGLALACGGNTFDRANQNAAIAFDESPGALDTISMSTENASNPFEIAYLAIKKIA